MRFLTAGARVCFLSGMSVCAVQMLSHAAQGADSELVLKKIQNYDRIYSAALTVRGEVVESPDVEAPYMGSPHKEWVLSLQGERHALVETLLDRDLTYRAPSEYEQFGDDLLGISFDEEDNLFRHFFTSKAVSYESDRSATVEVSTIVQISPDGKIQSEKESRAVMRYGAGDYTLAFPIKKLLWAMGRGYGLYLDKASEVSDAENGLLTLVAEGTCISPEHFGKWELTLDPKAQYLVRNAKFFPTLRRQQCVCDDNDYGSRDYGFSGIPHYR